MTANRPIRIAIIGAGAVSDYHHVPAIRLNPRADSSQALLDARRNDCWVEFLTDNYEKVCGHDDIDAVIVSTPNDVHHPIATAAAGHGKHVMCEKPLGLSATEVREMYHAARDARVHMTAFTYRFAPAMRYLRHLVASGALGEPRHFRSQRFLDLPESSWGWRQYKGKAGAGDLFDMTIHCIDFAIKGYDLNGFGHEWAEVNGSEGSAVYRLHEPNTILLGKTGEDLAPVAVPTEYLKPTNSPREMP